MDWGACAAGTGARGRHNHADTYSHLWPTAEDRTRNDAEGLVLSTLQLAPADSQGASLPQFVL